tara:strand:- start:655 stop:843 length:189 start_codon:yes stop_codon:yes gene_type:complete
LIQGFQGCFPRKQLTNVIVQHAHATQAEGGADFYPMGPGSAMNTEFTATIAMESQPCCVVKP